MTPKLHKKAKISKSPRNPNEPHFDNIVIWTINSIKTYDNFLWYVWTRYKILKAKVWVKFCRFLKKDKITISHKHVLVTFTVLCTDFAVPYNHHCFLPTHIWLFFDLFNNNYCPPIVMVGWFVCSFDFSEGTGDRWETIRRFILVSLVFTNYCQWTICTKFVHVPLNNIHLLITRRRQFGLVGPSSIIGSLTHIG